MHRKVLHKAGMEKHERLKKARRLAGFKSAADAARRLGVPYGTYSGHENGSRGIKNDELKSYARTFRVTLEYLAFGRTSDQTNFFPVVGTIEDRGVVKPVTQGLTLAGEEDLFREELPIHWIGTTSFVAYRVEATDLSPGYNPGEYILCWPIRRTDFSVFRSSFVVAESEDGATHFRILHETPSGMDLLTHPATNPLAGVRLRWARRICLVLKAEFLTGPIEQATILA